MLVVIKKDYEEVSREAARIVAGAVRAKPTIVLGLATGSTPLGLSQELIALYRAANLDFCLASRLIFPTAPSAATTTPIVTAMSSPSNLQAGSTFKFSVLVAMVTSVSTSPRQ